MAGSFFMVRLEYLRQSYCIKSIHLAPSVCLLRKAVPLQALGGKRPFPRPDENLLLQMLPMKPSACQGVCVWGGPCFLKCSTPSCSIL